MTLETCIADTTLFRSCTPKSITHNIFGAPCCPHTLHWLTLTWGHWRVAFFINDRQSIDSFNTHTYILYIFFFLYINSKTAGRITLKFNGQLSLSIKLSIFCLIKSLNNVWRDRKQPCGAFVQNNCRKTVKKWSASYCLQAHFIRLS